MYSIENNKHKWQAGNVKGLDGGKLMRNKTRIM